VTTEAVRRALDEVAARKKAEAAARPAPAPAAPRPTPEVVPEGQLATPTLAELYVAQGHREKAADVYRAILERDPRNRAARDRLNELEDELAGQQTRRRALETSIARLERLLEAVERGRRA